MGTPIYWLGPDQPESNSGSPYYFLEALQLLFSTAGDEAVNVVRYPRVREKLIAAATWGIVLKSDPRIYALSPEYMDRLLKGKKIPRPSLWLSRSQLLPAQLLDADPKVVTALYVDCTLTHLFQNYKEGRQLSQSAQRHFLDRERLSYRRADMIFCYHAGTKRELLELYNVPPERVTIIGRGANMSVPLEDKPVTPASAARKLRLIFVGREPKRKGLFDLIDAIDALVDEDKGKVELLVVGPNRWEVPKRPYITSIGYLHASQRPQLIELMQSADVGVLLSRAEGLPGFVWEMLYLGKPVLATALEQYLELPKTLPMIYVAHPVRAEEITRAVKNLIDDQGTQPPLSVAERKALSWEGPAQKVAQWMREMTLTRNER